MALPPGRTVAGTYVPCAVATRLRATIDISCAIAITAGRSGELWVPARRNNETGGRAAVAPIGRIQRAQPSWATRSDNIWEKARAALRDAINLSTRMGFVT